MGLISGFNVLELRHCRSYGSRISRWLLINSAWRKIVPLYIPWRASGLRTYIRADSPQDISSRSEVLHIYFDNPRSKPSKIIFHKDNMPRPTIVLVNGAWHSPEFFSGVISILELKGYKCVAIAMPGVGRSPPVASLDEDIAAVRNAVMKELDLGNNVMMHAHSESQPGGLPKLVETNTARLGRYTHVQRL